MRGQEQLPERGPETRPGSGREGGRGEGGGREGVMKAYIEEEQR